MRIGICDDQPEICELLADKIKQIYPEENIIIYPEGNAVLAEADLPDILFLDIQMPEPDGMETARKLRRIDKQMILIFVTAMEEYVFQAFDVGAFHYLVKPFTDEKFAEVLKNAAVQVMEQKASEAARAKKEKPALVITTGGRHLTVRLEDLVYAEVYDRKVILHTIDEDIEYYGRMKDLEKKAGDSFFRSHRAYLVNFDYVRKYDAVSIELEKGRALMARQNYQKFVKCYLRYIADQTFLNNGIEK